MKNARSSRTPRPRERGVDHESYQGGVAVRTTQTVEAQIEERSRVIEQLRADASQWERRALDAGGFVC